MSDFPVHTHDSAPEGSRPTLEASQKAYGFVPNLHGMLASAPAALKSYAAVMEIFSQSSFDGVEQQVVLLSVSHQNACTYCMGAHSMVANMAGMDEATLNAIREGRELPDPKLDALAALTRDVVSSRGYPGDGTVQAFLEAGYGRAQILDVLVGVSVKTLSNYANHIAETPLDDAFAPFAWSPEAVGAGS